MIPVDGWRKKCKFTNPCAHASLSNKLYVYILYKNDCIDMQLEKNCMQTSPASKHRKSLIHDKIVCTYIRTFMDAPFYATYQLLWMRNEQVLLYIKVRRGILRYEKLYSYKSMFYSYLKTANIMSIHQYRIMQHDTTPQGRTDCALNLWAKQWEVAHINDLEWVLIEDVPYLLAKL